MLAPKRPPEGVVADAGVAPNALVVEDWPKRPPEAGAVVDEVAGFAPNKLPAGGVVVELEFAPNNPPDGVEEALFVDPNAFVAGTAFS